MASRTSIPNVILTCPDIPYTISGKKVELAVKKVLEGKIVKNKSALRNPECLEFFKNTKV
jgi:acetoacetyl-CoA synthetase